MTVKQAGIKCSRCRVKRPRTAYKMKRDGVCTCCRIVEVHNKNSKGEQSNG